MGWRDDDAMALAMMASLANGSGGNGNGGHCCHCAVAVDATAIISSSALTLVAKTSLLPLPSTVAFINNDCYRRR